MSPHHESLTASFGFYYTIEELLHERKTRYQDLKVVRTAEFGRVLLLDQITQVAEKNEFMYHELITHPSLLSHPHPQEVLVIGGGDGGTCREALKHSSLKTVHHVDLDEEVIDVCKTYFPSLSKGVFENPKLHVNIGDGRAFLDGKEAIYDVIIMDMTDPIGPSRRLYTVEFFQKVHRALKADGLFHMHIGSPITYGKVFAQLYRTLKHVFHHVNVLTTYIQMYGTLWAVAVCSDLYDLRLLPKETLTKRLHERRIPPLSLITSDTFHAMQISYPYIDTLLKTPYPLISDATLDALVLHENA